MGSTLIDETAANKHRIYEMIAGTDITYHQYMEKKLYNIKQNKPADQKAINFFGLTKTPWHKEDEILYPDAMECLKKLHLFYKTGIIANQYLGSEEWLRKFGLWEYIDVLAASAKEGVSKPDIRLLEIALEKAECSAKEEAMVGDRLDNDIVPANQLGMYTIWIRQEDWKNAQPRKRIGVPDRMVYTLTQLIENLFKRYFTDKI